MSKRLTIDEFILKSKSIHDLGHYDYTETILGKNNKEKVCIRCLLCDVIFEQTPNDHMRGHGCPGCKNKSAKHHKLLDIDIFIQRACNTHGNRYDYSKFIYSGSNKTSVITCNIHGDFQQTAHNHLSGSACPKCANIQKGLNRRQSIDDFITKAQSVHGSLYDYSLVKLETNHTKVKIKCNKCGNIFNQTPNTHLVGCGCPQCKNSKGEHRIRNWLLHKEIPYSQQHSFADCKNIKPLPFDFYIHNLNLCIEYDGSLHYIPWDKSEKSIKKFEMTQMNDNIKTQYCINNNIGLLRIPYWDYDKIESILSQSINY